MDSQKYAMAISDVSAWVCVNAANELFVKRTVPSVDEGILPHPVLVVPRGEILSFIDADTVTKEMLYDTISSLAGVSDLLQNVIRNAVISVDDLDLHNIADWPWWTYTESEDGSAVPCQSGDLLVVLVFRSEIQLISPFQPRRFLATDLDDRYIQMWENINTFRLLNGSGVSIATGVNAYDPFSSPALSNGGVAEELYGKGYELKRLLIIVHGFHPAYTPDPHTSGQQMAIPVSQMQSLLMYCLQCSFPNAVIIVTHKHAKFRKNVGGPPLTLLSYEADALFGRIWNRVESSREEMFGENMCMVSNFDVLPPEVAGRGGLDLHKALRAAMMAGWPLMQCAQNHCELTASLIFQSSTIIQGGQHHWDTPHLNRSDHGYRKAVGVDFAGIVQHKAMISEGDCISLRDGYLRIVEESKLDDGSSDFHALMIRMQALLGASRISRSTHMTSSPMQAECSLPILHS